MQLSMGKKMHALPVLFAAALIVSVLGLSLIPSTTLGQNEESEEMLSRAGHDGDGLPENAETQSRALLG
jgi:hypothetical protein